MIKKEGAIVVVVLSDNRDMVDAVWTTKVTTTTTYADRWMAMTFFN
jgi:hypothetical protein